jgi:hypothetical protein
VKIEQSEAIAPVVHGMSRRREVRVEPPPALVVHVVGVEGTHTIRDLSARGLCVHTGTQLAPQSIYRVTLTFGRVVVKRRARTIHCHRVSSGGFLSGMEFLQDPMRESWTMEDLVNLVLSTSITFF